jgi:hypothetical protein
MRATVKAMGMTAALVLGLVGAVGLTWADDAKNLPNAGRRDGGPGGSR